MPRLQLSLSCTGYDRVRPLFDGRVQIEGVDLIPSAIEPEEGFHRAFKFGEFDIAELSISSHTLTVSRGENDYVGIPVMVSRVFRQSGFYIRTDRGIDRPQDLRGRKIGLRGYQITANTWMRGILQDEYGVAPQEIHWRRGGIEEPGQGEHAVLRLPSGIDLQDIPGDRTLSGMLESGELDGVINPRAPSCFLRGAPHVARLFPDYRKEEEDYFRRTGIFPIMHIIGIRKSLVEQHPWLPVNVYKGFLEAKRIAERDLNEIGHLMVALPWLIHEFNATRALMGDDYWPYGFPENRKVLDAFTRYHFEQGLSARKVASEELFAASTLNLSKL
jgi:4,5-dihydroxyphthalate decarboxylase